MFLDDEQTTISSAESVSEIEKPSAIAGGTLDPAAASAGRRAGFDLGKKAWLERRLQSQFRNQDPGLSRF